MTRTAKRSSPRIPAELWPAARIQAARWRRLRSRLSDPEWPPRTAAYLSVGLDPEETEDGDQGWSFSWLPACPKDDFGGDQYSLERNVEMELDRMMRLTGSAAPAKVRSPHQWIRWYVKIGCEPPWLLPAYRRRSVARLLPSLPVRKPDPPALSRSQSEHQRRAALGKAERSAAGKAKPHVRAEFDKWVRAGRPGRVSDLASAISAKHTDVEWRTIYSWLLKCRRAEEADLG